MAMGAVSHSTYINPDGKTITITKSKETDSFLGVITGTNHTTSMNFISGEHFVSLYPIQTLKKQTTYVYHYPLNTTVTATLVGRGYTVVTDSINHPKICCPVAQCQFVTLKEVGLLQWSITDKSHVISPQSYSWQLGDICLDANCITKTVKNQLIRRISFCEDDPNSDGN